MRLRIKSNMDENNTIRWIVQKKYKLFGWCDFDIKVNKILPNPIMQIYTQVIYFIVFVISLLVGHDWLNWVLVSSGVYLVLSLLTLLIAVKIAYNYNYYISKNRANAAIEKGLKIIKSNEKFADKAKKMYGGGYCEEFPIYQISGDEIRQIRLAIQSRVVQYNCSPNYLKMLDEQDKRMQLDEQDKRILADYKANLYCSSNKI